MTATGGMRSLAMACLCFGLALGVAEAALRIVAQNPDSGPPRLLGRALPPLDLIPARLDGAPAWDAPSVEQPVNGVVLTRGDLWGLSREDPLLGHEPLESTRSANGWWESNSQGARARREYAPTPPHGVFRALAFGDSYTNGSRVRQEDAWPAVLEAARPDLEIVNFGVDGYGMGQSLLRYRKRGSALEHDLVILVFVPGADLVREVNTARWLLGWRAPLVPRFALEGRPGTAPTGEELRLVRSPYASMAELAADSRDAPSAKLLSHLRRHDSLYWATRYERVPVVGDLYSVRLAMAALNAWRDRQRPAALYRPSSEAARITRALLRTLSREVRGRGDRLLLAQLPTEGEVERARHDARFVSRWRVLRDFTCPPDATCLDLLPPLLAQPRSELDTGVGSHHGPRANRAIAEQIERAIDALRARAAQT